MAAKKKGKKVARGVDKSASTPAKITLPAYGLAEEILGTQAEIKDQGQGAAGRLERAASGESVAVAQGPADSAQQDAGPTLHLVTFNLDGEEYGVDIGSV